MSASNIHTGTWTDYSRGNVYGLTLTLTNSQAVAFVSFLAVLITHTGTRSFTILRFILHQTRKHETPRDGLARQHDLVLRNAETDIGTLSLIHWIAFKWRGHTPHPYRRTVPLLLLVLIHTVGFLVAGVAVSLVADGGEALVIAKGTACGAWAFDQSNRNVEAVSLWQLEKQKGISAAQAYARMCYDGTESDLIKTSPSECRVFPTQKLNWTDTHNATCPFKDGICLEGETAAYMLDTGLQSSRKLGINSQYELQWQHRTTCAPLKTDGYTQVRDDGNFGENVTYYNYGPVGLLGNWTHYVSDWERAGGSKNFILDVQTSAPWIGNNTFQLDPIPALQRNDSDVTLFFVGAYGVNYFAPVDDPIFSAHQSEGDFLMPGYAPFPIYTADYPATVLGCIDQYRYCNPRLKKCSPFVPSHWQEDELLAELTENKGEMDVAVLMRIYTSLMMNLYWQTINNLAAVLSINDNVFSGSVGFVAREQWKLEAAHIFELGLAGAQVEITRMAKDSYPHSHGPLKNVLPPEFHNVCRMIMFHESGYTSISVFGLCVIIIVSAIITTISYMDGVVARLMWKRWPHRVLAWRTDTYLQLLRLVNENKRIGTWKQGLQEIPVTEKGETLGVVEVVGGRIGIGRVSTSISTSDLRPANDFGPRMAV